MPDRSIFIPPKKCIFFRATAVLAGKWALAITWRLSPASIVRRRFPITCAIVFAVKNSGAIFRTLMAAVAKLLAAANALRRGPQPISKLILAENCGGSDGNSGITANPALGVASDELVRYGGTSVLAETPEIYGAEHLLTQRAVSREVG